MALATASIAGALAHAAPAPSPAPDHPPTMTAAAAVRGATAPRPATAPASTPPPVVVLGDACPAQLPVTQTVSETIAGWTPQNQQGSYLFVRIAFFPGPPADTRLIVPTIEFQGAAGLHDGWDLPPRQGGYWMTCAYANTTATLARPLPAGIDFCQADYDKRFITLVVRRWSCGLRRNLLPPRPGSKQPYRRGP
jgi:hypothetical protein